MKRTLLATAVLSSCVAILPAQQATNDANPLYRPTMIRMSTLVVPPIEGVPFSATALIGNKQTMPDGTLAASRNINLIGRDSRGRTHGEMRRRVPESSTDTPVLVEVHLYDPQTGIRTICYPATHIATRQLAPQPLAPVNVDGPPSPLVKVEDLGRQTLENIDVKGTRRVVVVPAAANNTGAPITVVDEYWYSEDLHVNILLIHNDPRTGVQTLALTDIKREDPPTDFFAVPENYKIVDITPPAGVVRGRAVAGPTSR